MLLGNDAYINGQYIPRRLFSVVSLHTYIHSSIFKTADYTIKERCHQSTKHNELFILCLCNVYVCINWGFDASSSSLGKTANIRHFFHLARFSKCTRTSGTFMNVHNIFVPTKMFVP
jgi:hypothetical protein